MKNCCQLLMILAIYFCSMLAHGEEKNDDFERNSSFFEKVCYLVDQMTVFPIDLIAPSGELAMTDNHGYPKMNVRYDLSYDQFENFYDFYQLSKKANQNDVEICVQKLRDQNLSPKLKAMILTLLYIYSRNDVSWMCDFKLTKLKLDSELDSSKIEYVKFIAEFVDSQEVAYESVDVTEEDKQIRIREIDTIVEEMCSLFKVSRLELLSSSCEDLQKWYDEESQKHDLDSDVLKKLEFVAYRKYPNMERRGGRGANGNSSSCNKTLGQIARQLLESWDPPQTIDDQE